MRTQAELRRLDLAHFLARRIPATSVDYVADLMADHPIEFVISRPRRTRLGFYRPPTPGRARHHISVNEDLNPYAFLITLLHEIAHMHVYLEWSQLRQRRVAPHGHEWKVVFSSLLGPVAEDPAIPNDVAAAIEDLMVNPQASSCTNPTLVSVLGRYDHDGGSIQRLDDLPHGSTFRLTSGRVFRHKQRLRTWHLCEEVGTRKRFRVRGSSRVEIVAAADLPASKR